MAEALVIALLGAECSGKTTLAAALAERLSPETGRRCAWVSETLRDWCERAGRTPAVHEQSAIARLQHDRIRAAAAANDIVIADTSALQTAMYSRIVFGDHSLDDAALRMHRRDVHFTLLTAPDLPWVADGHQRDGAHVRAPVDALLRERLIGQRLPWAPVSGLGAARLEAAVDALAPLLRPRSAGRAGLFTRLADRNAQAEAARWTCECCDVPECEHASLRPRG